MGIQASKRMHKVNKNIIKVAHMTYALYSKSYDDFVWQKCTFAIQKFLVKIVFSILLIQYVLCLA